MDKWDYHKFFDAVYNVLQDQKFLDIIRESRANVEEGDSRQKASAHGSPHRRVHQQLTRYTIHQDSWYYKVFNVFKISTNWLACIMYAHYASKGIPPVNRMSFLLFIAMEIIMFSDLILNFFVQPLQEDGQSMNMALEEIAKNYLENAFMYDLISWVPFGLLQNVNRHLSVLWLLKTLRIRELIVYTQKRYY